MIESICQNCGNKKMFSEDKSGKKYKCPNCSEVVTIESIGTNIVNTSESNVTNSFADSLRQAEEDKKRAEQKTQFDTLIKKSKKWKNWSIFFWVLAGISLLMIFDGEKDGIQSLFIWSIIAAILLYKSDTIKKEAKRLYPLAASTVNTGGSSTSVITSSPNTSIESTKAGVINITFAGQWFVMDAKTKIYVENNLHSTHSTKEGFNAEIPITSSYMNIKVEISGIKSTTYTLQNLDPQKGYIMQLAYNDTWGKYSKEYNLIELNKKV